MAFIWGDPADSLQKPLKSPSILARPVTASGLSPLLGVGVAGLLSCLTMIAFFMEPITVVLLICFPNLTSLLLPIGLNIKSSTLALASTKAYLVSSSSLSTGYRMKPKPCGWLLAFQELWLCPYLVPSLPWASLYHPTEMNWVMNLIH